MRTIKSLDDLNIPDNYRIYITHYLMNLRENKFFSHINKVILFGSCAREAVKDFSDIDIFLMPVQIPVLKEKAYPLHFHIV